MKEKLPTPGNFTNLSIFRRRKGCLTWSQSAIWEYKQGTKQFEFKPGLSTMEPIFMRIMEPIVPEGHSSKVEPPSQIHKFRKDLWSSTQVQTVKFHEIPWRWLKFYYDSEGHELRRQGLGKDSLRDYQHIQFQRCTLGCCPQSFQLHHVDGWSLDKGWGTGPSVNVVCWWHCSSEKDQMSTWNSSWDIFQHQGWKRLTFKWSANEDGCGIQISGVSVSEQCGHQFT